jgi:hypothetical protein
MDEFNWNLLLSENKGKKLVRINKYPNGCDKFDESIIDLFFELQLTDKNMSATVFEKTVMRKYIEESTKLSFYERLKKLNELGIPIEVFKEEAIALKIGVKKTKTE